MADRESLSETAPAGAPQPAGTPVDLADRYRLPSYERAPAILFHEVQNALVRIHRPILAEITIVVREAIPRHVLITEKGSLAFDPAPHHSEGVLHHADAWQGNYAAFIDPIVETSEAVADRLVAQMLEALGPACELTGQTMSGKGSLVDRFIDAIEKCRGSVRPDGRVSEQFKCADAQGNLVPIEKVPLTHEQLERLQRIIAAKVEEHRARKRSRRIR